jgi:hypothetical protein
MNNILTFEDYRKMNIRQVESVMYRQFVEEDIKPEVNEGLIRKIINKRAGNFIHKALADEIEKGKELEWNIKNALDGLNKGFEEIEKKFNSEENENGEESKHKLNAIEQVKEAISAVQSQTFDTLTMLGSEGEIDFAGFMGSATVSAAANFGIIFSPIKSVFITRKAYKYFLEIVKQTIRRNLLIIQLNFDQFENLILQKSFESEEDSERMTKSNTLHDIITTMTEQLCGKDSKIKILPNKKIKDMKNYLDNFKKVHDETIKLHKEDAKYNPLRSLWEDQHNNTYTKTLEQIKQYINEDSQKELDSLKNSITKMAANDVDLSSYGELIIAAAEEYAIKTNYGINNNFIKMSSVFNLDNQKKLIELIKSTQEENEREANNKLNELKIEEENEKTKKHITSGKSLYEKKLKDKDSYTFDNFNDEFSEDDIISLKSFFQTDEGKDEYKKLIDENPLYKYFIPNNDVTLYNFLNSINNLKIVEISEIDDFYQNFTEKNQSLYYLMAERSIKDAIKSKSSDEYYGFNINNNEVEDNILVDNDVNSILKNFITPKKYKNEDAKKRYFLTFESTTGDSLFEILHDFKTEMFDSDKYKDSISTESKQTIIKLIDNNLNIGKGLYIPLAEYLVRLEAHMSLVKKDDLFVIQNNNVLFEEKCFGDGKKFNTYSNKNAFVEINKEHVDDIKKFLNMFHDLSKNDFIIPETQNENDNNK